jgi:tripartite-type tricarboxylate transporter receptor subunit TctC
MMLVANPAVPANSLQELMGLARQKNNQLSFSSPGNASQTHLVMAQLFDMAGVQAIHVPYRGGSPSLLATLSNETQFTLISSVLAATHLESKKLRALAIGSLNRDPLFPEVPTFAEAGFAGLEAVTWVGLFAPAQTPAPIIALLNKEIDRLIREPSIAGNLQKQGIAISGGSPEVLGKLVTSEISAGPPSPAKAAFLLQPNKTITTIKSLSPGDTNRTDPQPLLRSPQVRVRAGCQSVHRHWFVWRAPGS